ncbi:MAG TPA: LuxR C-terminal-related transcriptional regulator [Anaerovoracaceae bacterium]|nr:LuxR C-terminal-related transcriptional regulator [Anaerovoracaceae bacterium]
MLQQHEWEQINRMVSEMNRIRDITRFRREFLTLLGRLIAFDLADFYLNDSKPPNRVKLVDPVVVSRFSRKFNERFMLEYDRYYGQVDYVRWVFSSHESVVYRESDLINAELRTKSAFYLDYLKPAGFINVAGVSIADQGACIGAVTLYRTDRYGDFTDKDLYVLEQMLPHLQNKLASETEAVQHSIKQNKNGSYFLAHEFNLSKREIEILRLLCDGKNNNEISRQLSISVNTVKKHISNIFYKLNVDSRTQLIHFIVKNDKEILEAD